MCRAPVTFGGGITWNLNELLIHVQIQQSEVLLKKPGLNNSQSQKVDSSEQDQQQKIQISPNTHTNCENNQQ